MAHDHVHVLSSPRAQPYKHIPLPHIHPPLLTHAFCTLYFPNMYQGLEQHRSSLGRACWGDPVSIMIMCPFPALQEMKNLPLKKICCIHTKRRARSSTNFLETLILPCFKKQDLVLLATKSSGQGLKLVDFSSPKSRCSLRYLLPSSNSWLCIRVHQPSCTKVAGCLHICPGQTY